LTFISGIHYSVGMKH